jgi:small subunit ribosomal protein S17
MSKLLTGKIVSVKMQNTVLVEVVRRTPHKLYGKLLKRSKKYKADPSGKELEVGQMVKIEETKPISKDKHFIVKEVLKEKKA